MATTTADPAAEPVDVAQAPVPDPRPKRKWRTFTMSEEAYDTLTATSEALGTNRSRLIEDLILREHRAVTLFTESDLDQLAGMPLCCSAMAQRPRCACCCIRSA